jgi:hypothetical protein
MICPKCGFVNKDAANFCTNCAEPLTIPKPAPIEPPSEDFLGNEEIEVPTPPTPARIKQRPTPRRLRKYDTIDKILLIGIFTSLAVAVLALVFGSSLFHI